MKCMTVKMVADRLAMSQSSIYRLVNDRELGCYRPSEKTVRISEDHLKQYLERKECPANQHPASGRLSKEKAGGDILDTADMAADLNGFRSERKIRQKQRNFCLISNRTATGGQAT